MPDEFTELNRANINAAITGIKTYVDERTTVGLIYYFTNTASDVGGYKKMIPTYDGAAKVTYTNTNAVDDEAIEEFVTEPGVPGVTFLDEGIYDVHIHAKNTQIGSKNASIYYELYKRTIAPAETLIATSNNTATLTTDETEYSIHCSHIAIELNATDRLIIKLIISVSGVGVDPDVLTYIQGTGADVTASRLTMPSLSQIIGDMASATTMDARDGVGTGNTFWIPLFPLPRAEGRTNYGHTLGIAIWSNLGSDDHWVYSYVPIPLVLPSGEELYLKTAKYGILDADAGDKINRTIIN